ncbi:Crp/Fnr family transcriptional regulator [Aureispira anguillae]|uniref:Crp/Fnr family transcriptional regulator n=1 Tax=Aureispira anguillae TaxID=2864201 RepID=A0A915YJH4_9BACT|nr:Crp/Fnr family transcriptional regulator [Aureispira anguillae]BDS14324.1 Crp/Fnr family transcriptional regulator [Aureispira anguillae]
MQTAAKLWYLEQFDIFKVLSKRELKRMAETALHKHYKKDDPIMFPFNSQKTIYLLKEGAVKIGNYTESGEENLKYLINSGTIFGEMALVDGNSNDFAVAVESCIVCTLNTNVIQEIMTQNKAFNRGMYKLIGLRLRKVESKLSTIVYKDSFTRIVDFLKAFAQEFGKDVDNVLVVKNFLTNTEIAKLTFTSRQTVNSVLNKLKRENRISYDDKYLRILDL